MVPGQTLVMALERSANPPQKLPNILSAERSILLFHLDAEKQN